VDSNIKPALPMKSWPKIRLATLAVSIAAIAATGTSSGQTLFSQDFSSSSTVSSYVSSSSPTTGQFNSIGAGASNTATISSSALVFNKTGNTSSGFVRTTDFSTTPSALLFSFDLNVTGNSVSETSSTNVILQLGSGFSTSVGAEANSAVHSRIAINWTATSGHWSIRRGGVTGTSAVSGNYTGSQTVRWYVNNDTTSISYRGPDNLIYSLASDTYDVWIGLTRETNLTSVGATSGTVALNDFKFAYNSAGENASITLDNLAITAIPEPSTYTAILGVLALGGVATRRRRRSSVSHD
jgi:PEP-CTERM motif